MDQKQTPTDAQVQVARIGSGNKLHPILHTERYGWGFLCNCPGTQNGQARITWRGPGAASCDGRGICKTSET